MESHAANTVVDPTVIQLLDTRLTTHTTEANISGK